MKIKVSELRNVTRQALRYYGYDEDEIEIILEILMYAQLRGNNQGIVKLIGAGMPKNHEAGEIKIARETKLSALLNGQNNHGMIVLSRAAEIALEKAKTYGFGIVGTFNTNTSTGAIGYYAEKIANQNMIGFVFAGTPQVVTTYGSYERLFGTNPMAIGIPTEASPIVFDMATAAIAYYGLVQAKTAEQKIPNDVAYDLEGHSTTDPGKALEGSIRPFDRSYKGAGLALMIEVLTGPLVAASFTGIGEQTNWGNLIYVVDPGLLIDKELFTQQVSQMIKTIKDAKKVPGVDEIFYPGERGTKRTQAALESGEVEIEENLWVSLKKVIEN